MRLLGLQVGVYCSCLAVLPGCLLQEWDGDYIPPEDETGDSWGDERGADEHGDGDDGGTVWSTGSSSSSSSTGSSTNTSGIEGDEGDLPTLGELDDAEILRTGVEYVLLGSDYGSSELPGLRLRSDRSSLIDFALSSDGEMVWALLLDPRAEGPADDTLEVWALPTDGSDALQSRFDAPPEAALLSSARLHTDATGERALLLVPWQVATDEQGSIVREHTIYLAARSGRALEPIVDTSQLPDFEAVAGNLPLYSAFAALGNTVLIHNGRQLWAAQAENDGPWSAEPRFDLATWLDDGGDGGAARLYGLEIGDEGRNWVAAVHHPGAEQPFMMLLGDDEGAAELQVHQPGGLAAPFSLDGAGNSFVYSVPEAQPLERQTYIAHRSIAPRALRADIETIYEGMISGDARSLYLVNGHGDGSQFLTSYFNSSQPIEDRVMAHSDAFVGPAARSVQLSRDAQTMAAPVRLARTGHDARRGLWVSHRKPGPAHGAARIEVIRHGFDTAGYLVLQIEVQSEYTVLEAYAMPVYNDYIDPAHLFPVDQNPLHNLRREPFQLIHGESPAIQRFELRLDLDGKEAELNGAFGARIVVATGEADSLANRLVYADIALPMGGKSTLD